MRKSYIILEMAVICAVVSLCFAGCGSDDNDAKSTNTETVAETVSDDKVIEDDKADNKSPSVQDASKEDKDEPKGPSANECMKAYQAFLNGKIREGDTLGISDFAEELCDNFTREYGYMNVLPEAIRYSYIDCGNDGIPELAVAFDGVGTEYMKSNYITVFKLVDDKIKCIFNKSYGYRAFAMLNEYGYYTYGGSNGASSHSTSYSFIDSDGKVNFLYGIYDDFSAHSFYIPDNAEYVEVAREEGIADNIEIEQYYYSEYDDEQSYNKFLTTCDFIYYPVSGNFDRLEGDRLTEATKGGAYERFWESTGLKASTEEQVNRKLDVILEKAGVTDEIVNGAEAEWTDISEAMLEDILAWKSKFEIPVTSLTNIGWEYYYSMGEPKPTAKLSLKVISKESNSITDDDLWFDNVDMSKPDSFDFGDNDYRFKLYGEDAAGLKWYPYMMDIYDAVSDAKIYSLDFTDYYTPDSIAIGDEAYVEESIHWATIEDGILYVSTFHNTYASSAPHNGYITALDMNDNFKVLWRSEPLTCNSNNFVITDDAIICGYGFTAEDDYVYVLDKATGARVNSYKVKTSPEWFVIYNNVLFVRCYDTNYAFEIEK